MPFGGPKKTWREITQREIFTSLAAFSLIGALIVIACVYDLLHKDLGFLVILPVLGIVFITGGISFSYAQAIRELRRRAKG